MVLALQVVWVKRDLLKQPLAQHSLMPDHGNLLLMRSFHLHCQAGPQRLMRTRLPIPAAQPVLALPGVVNQTHPHARRTARPRTEDGLVASRFLPWWPCR